MVLLFRQDLMEGMDSSETSHSQQFKTRRRALPESTQSEAQAIEGKVSQPRFVAPPMTEMLQEPGAQRASLFAHQGQKKGIG
jgi:hypothetical protein